ncbi:MAG: class I SAM-dependent methyltransferase [Fimbriimonadales bacterium]
MALLPTRYLSVAGAYAGAVYIPLESLERRTHELPPPTQEIWVIRDAPAAFFVLGWLHARGRRARLVDAPPPHANPTARYRLWMPNEWLQAVIESGEPIAKPCPRALDLGCGSGREAVYLAERGWKVVAVDRLPEALTRGRDLQQRYAPDSPPIEWVCADLEKSNWQPEGVFDGITLFYFYAPELLPRACAWLNKGGMLLVEAFTETHRARFGKPASNRRVVRAGELPRLLPDGMRVVAYSEAWRNNGRHTARLWATRA